MGAAAADGAGDGDVLPETVAVGDCAAALAGSSRVAARRIAETRR
jgi:hypothetical protein